MIFHNFWGFFSILFIYFRHAFVQIFCVDMDMYVNVFLKSIAQIHVVWENEKNKLKNKFEKFRLEKVIIEIEFELDEWLDVLVGGAWCVGIAKAISLIWWVVNSW